MSYVDYVNFCDTNCTLYIGGTERKLHSRIQKICRQTPAEMHGFKITMHIRVTQWNKYKLKRPKSSTFTKGKPTSIQEARGLLITTHSQIQRSAMIFMVSEMASYFRNIYSRGFLRFDFPLLCIVLVLPTSITQIPDLTCIF